METKDKIKNLIEKYQYSIDYAEGLIKSTGEDLDINTYSCWDKQIMQSKVSLLKIIVEDLQEIIK